MQKKPTLYHRLYSVVQLDRLFSYQLLFVFSSVLYHSVDLWLFASLLETQTEAQSGLAVLGFLKLGTLPVILNIVSLILGVYVVGQIVIWKKSTYLIEIQQKLVFPILFMVFTLSLSSGSYLGKISSEEASIYFQAFLTFSVRYPESLQKGLNRLSKSEFFITIAKLGVTFIFGVFSPENRILCLILISVLNVAINVAFNLRLFYQKPTIQYLSLVSQFFIWIPNLCGYLNYFGVHSLSVWIIYTVGLLMTGLVSIIKPKFLLVILEQKYIKNVSDFSRQIRTYNPNDIFRHQNFQTLAIGYLSIARNVILFKNSNPLQWSQGFVAKILNVLRFDINCMEKIFQYEFSDKRDSGKSQKQIYLADKLSSEGTSMIYDKSETIKDKQKDQNQNVKLFDKVNIIIAELLERNSFCTSQIFLFTCYNFIDCSNQMKHRIFYSFFIAMSKNKDFFDKINLQVCYNHLLQKINHQHGGYPKLEVNCMALVKSSECKQFEKDISSQSCLTEFQSNFNSAFNDVIEEESIYTEVLNYFQRFIDNEESYIFWHEQSQASKIPDYFRIRNFLRKEIEKRIEDYANLPSNSCRVQILTIFNYLKDMFLRQDPVIAYDNFNKNLDEFIKKIYVKTPNNFCGGEKSNSPQNSMYCVVSAIEEPDTIFTSCHQFKRLLEIQDRDMNSDEGNNKFKDNAGEDTESETNTHKWKLNRFFLPLWKEKHQKVVNKTSIDAPVDHKKKRYFLQSRKQTNVLEVSFKMYFHMLYENDMLMILDIEQQTLKGLEIWDREKTHAMYLHKRQKSRSDGTLYSDKGTRNALNSLLDQKVKSKLCDLEWFMKTKPQKIEQEIEIFETTYHIISTVVVTEKNPIQELVEVKLKSSKSLVHFEEPQNEHEKQNSLKENELRERKFSHQKNLFTFRKEFIRGTLFFYVFSIILVIVLLHLYETEKLDMINRLVMGLEDKILIEEDYAKDDLYRVIDVGMFSNIYQRQLSLTLLSPTQRSTLVQRILTSVVSAMGRMKKRHAVNPRTIIKGVKSQIFFNPTWVPISNVSFEMNSFRNELSYKQILQSHAKLSETYKYTAESQFSTRTINISYDPPKKVFPEIRKYFNGKYLIDTLKNKVYTQDPVNGVFAQFKKQGSDLFENVKKIQIQSMLIFLAFLLVNCLFTFALVCILVCRLAQKYWIASSTSQDFIKHFNNNVFQLKNCFNELSKFTKNSMTQIVEIKKPSAQDLKKRRIASVNSLKKTKALKLVADLKLNLDIKKSSNLKMKYGSTESLKENKVSKDKAHEQRLAFSRFYFTRLVFPVVRGIVILGIFLSVFKESWEHTDSLRTYQTGLSELTYVDMSFLNLFVTTLYITNFRQYQAAFDSSITPESLRQDFTDTISKISAKDKVEIIDDLFVRDNRREQIVHKILYESACEHFPQEIQCPSYMTAEVKGLYEKYSETIKNLNFLFSHLNHAKRTSIGTLDTSTFQSKYIENYYLIQELIFLSRKIKMMSFERLKMTMPLNQADDHVTGEESESFTLLLWVFVYLVLDGVITMSGIRREAKIIGEEFLRLGNYSMFEGEISLSDGYNVFVNNMNKENIVASEL